MSKIQTRHDQKRGCGWRKAGGTYLVSGGEGMPCCKLPMPLTICPCCGAGIKFCRSWTWIDADKLFPDTRCVNQSKFCPLANNALGRMGLLWVGEAFYKTPADFSEEAARLGISRRIATVPREFKLGETWVAFAHIKAISVPCGCRVEHHSDQPKLGPPVKDCPDCKGEGVTYTAGIFRIFKPDAIEYVVTGQETEEEIDALIKRGITPVRVERIGDTGEMELGDTINE